MKKSVFDLDDSELRKITQECSRTSYYKRYLLIYALSLCSISLFIIVSTIINCLYPLNNIYEILVYLIGILLIIIFSILFTLKKLELVQKYYSEKYKEVK